MNFTVKKNENYSLIKLEEAALSAANVDALKTECAKLVKTTPFLIFNGKALATIDKDQKSLLSSIDALANKAGGSIILTELSDENAEVMEKAGINSLPSDDEAVDFIFIEQMENQFADEDEEDEDDF